MLNFTALNGPAPLVANIIGQELVNYGEHGRMTYEHRVLIFTGMGVDLTADEDIVAREDFLNQPVAFLAGAVSA